MNIRGPRVEVDGAFRVTISMEEISDVGAYLHLYSELPVIYDEWRREPPSLRLAVRSGEVELASWDGSGDDPSRVETFVAAAEGRAVLTLRIDEGDTSVWEDGQELGLMPDPGLFGLMVFIGVDAEVGGDWRLSELSVSGAGDDDVRILDAPALIQASRLGTLRAVAADRDRPIGIGTAIAAAPSFADEECRAVAGTSFSMLTPENDFKPQFVQPRRGVFAFEEGDALVAFADANNMLVHAHTHSWGTRRCRSRRATTPPAKRWMPTSTRSRDTSAPTPTSRAQVRQY